MLDSELQVNLVIVYIVVDLLVMLMFYFILLNYNLIDRIVKNYLCDKTVLFEHLH